VWDIIGNAATQASVAERRVALPPLRELAMAEPTLTYRIWQDDMVWFWELFSNRDEVIASGSSPSSAGARSGAFQACIERQHPELTPKKSWT
jgi:hypothetical protein